MSAFRLLLGERYLSTVVHNIDSVFDPKTKQQVSVNQAVEEGILDETTGLFISVTIGMR